MCLDFKLIHALNSLFCSSCGNDHQQYFRLISLAHRATELSFSLAQEPNLLAPGQQDLGFFLPCIVRVNGTIKGEGYLYFLTPRTILNNSFSKSFRILLELGLTVICLKLTRSSAQWTIFYKAGKHKLDSTKAQTITLA